MIQLYTENIHDYNLRQQISRDNFRLPFCNTVSYSKSFIPCTLRLWNGLPASTKSSSSLNIFKTRLNSGTKASPKYFHIGDRKENIIHCQMRNDASNLNLHLQQHHFLTDHLAHIAMIPVKTPPIILCTALYIIFIGNNLLIPLMNLT